MKSTSSLHHTYKYPVLLRSPSNYMVVLVTRVFNSCIIGTCVYAHNFSSYSVGDKINSTNGISLYDCGLYGYYKFN